MRFPTRWCKWASGAPFPKKIIDTRTSSVATEVADSNERTPQTRVVSISMYVPYEGIQNAGGEYIRRHLDEVSKGSKTSVIAFATPENIQGASKVDPPSLDVILVNQPLWGKGLLTRALKRVIRKLAPILPPLDFAIRFMLSPDVRAALREADVVEFQHTELFVFVYFSRICAPDARFVGVVHDVINERLVRLMETKGLYGRTIGKAVTAFCHTIERVTCSSMDELLVFNSDSKSKLENLGVNSRFVIAPPPLDTPAMPLLEGPTQRSASAPRILFVGAFDRAENQQAALWLMDSIWPKILQKLPEAHLDIVGAKPSTEMLQAGRKSPNVTITGYVDTLDPYYQSASVTVVPLLRGAGVKFKTITAMLWAVPVVSTPIGAEGILNSDCYLAVTSDTVTFAEAVVRAHIDREHATKTAERALLQARSIYTQQAHAYAIAGIYPNIKASLL